MVKLSCSCAVNINGDSKVTKNNSGYFRDEKIGCQAEKSSKQHNTDPGG